MGKLCRVCLKKCVDFKAVEDYIGDVLDVLLLKINLTVSEEPVMCANCASMLMKCFEFKSTCFYTHDFIVPFLDDAKISKLDLRKVYMSKHKNVDIRDDYRVCGFCLGLAKKCTAVSLDKEDIMLEKLVEKYLPELDFSTIQDPMICAPCYESLKTCFHFVTSCSIVEEKIMEYRESTGADVIEIGDVLQWISRNGSFTHMEKKKLLPNEEIEIETDQYVLDRFQELLTENKSPSKVKKFQCEFCSYQAKWKRNLTRHLLIHKNPWEIKMFKCEICSYETKRKNDLRCHLFSHKSPSEIKMFKCGLCPYEAKLKRNLKTHLLIHKNASEIEMFKCEFCSYEAKQRSNLKTHLLTHKNPSEIKMFKCGLCPYEAKLKRNLKTHLLTHKNPSEIKMFKCELCSYEAKQRSNLKTHLLTHKNPSEIKMFKCELCSYEAKRRSCLKTHLLSHKNHSEIKLFKCEVCPYNTKHENTLIQHLLTHKSPEIKTFKGDSSRNVTFLS